VGGERIWRWWIWVVVWLKVMGEERWRREWGREMERGEMLGDVWVILVEVGFCAFLVGVVIVVAAVV
jgi:hypothetical protein